MHITLDIVMFIFPLDYNLINKYASINYRSRNLKYFVLTEINYFQNHKVD